MNFEFHKDVFFKKLLHFIDLSFLFSKSSQWLCNSQLFRYYRYLKVAYASKNRPNIGQKVFWLRFWRALNGLKSRKSKISFKGGVAFWRLLFLKFCWKYCIFCPFFKKVIFKMLFLLLFFTSLYKIWNKGSS